MTEYLKRDIAEILGLTPRKIQFWTDHIPIVPDIEPPRGKGFPRIYSEKNLIEFAMVIVLSNDFGIPLLLVKVILQILRLGKFDLTRDSSHDVDSKDFYTNTAWGDSKELIFLTDTIGLSKRRKYPVWFAEVKLDRMGNLPGNLNFFEGSGQKEYACHTILKLGAIKKMALKRIGIIG